MVSTSKTRPTNKRISTDPDGYLGAAPLAWEPHHSAPAAPPDRGRDCHFGDKNSVCNNNIPTAVDNPPPQTPCRTRRLPQHDFLQKAVQPWPGPRTFSLDIKDNLAAFGVWEA